MSLLSVSTVDDRLRAGVSVLDHFYMTLIVLDSRRESRDIVSFGGRRRGVCSVWGRI